jgi:hypothetical protein
MDSSDGVGGVLSHHHTLSAALVALSPRQQRSHARQESVNGMLTKSHCHSELAYLRSSNQLLELEYGRNARFNASDGTWQGRSSA